MKTAILLCAAVSIATVLSACTGTDGQKPDNDRIHGAVGVGGASQNTLRYSPVRPGEAPPPSSPSSQTSGTPFIPGSTTVY